MIHKGYIAWYEHDADDDVLHGRIAGIHDMITFVAPTREEMEREFRVAVDDYLSFCAEEGREPEAPPDPHGRTSLESSYKGFAGSFEVNPENGVLHGRVDGIDGAITFQADRLWELNREFRRRVDDYLAFRGEGGFEADRPYAELKRAVS